MFLLLIFLCVLLISCFDVFLIRIKKSMRVHPSFSSFYLLMVFFFQERSLLFFIFFYYYSISYFLYIHFTPYFNLHLSHLVLILFSLKLLVFFYLFCFLFLDPTKQKIFISYYSSYIKSLGFYIFIV